MYRRIFQNRKSIIGMIALPPLLGYPDFTSIDDVVDHAMADLDALQHGGVDGVCVENDYDRPHQLTVGAEVIASFTRVAHEVAQHANVPVGLQVLLNDWRASLAIARVIGAAFVRLDFFVDRARIQAGVIEPEPEAVVAYRKMIGADHVALFTDIHVKYSELLEPVKSIGESARQALAQGADAILVSGQWTGESPSLDDLREAREAIGDFPVLTGSGTTPNNVRELFLYADGAIVGTSLKDGTGPQNRIIEERVKQLMNQVRQA